MLHIHDTYKNSLMGIQCAHRVTVTRVSRVATEKHVGGDNYILHINASIEYGVE